MPRRGGGLLESERPLRRGGGVGERRFLRGVSSSDSESESECESESESDESESEESEDEEEEEASSMARRCSIMSFGAFYQKPRS
jgi:hypothetical protein